MKTQKIFISHSSKDKGFIATIYEDLRLIGTPVWFSPVEMPPPPAKYSNAELKAKLKDAVELCDAMLILVDNFSLDSNWVEYELSVAEQLFMRNKSFKVIPVINDPPKEPLPQFIYDQKPIDFNSGYKTALSELHRRLGDNEMDLFTINSAMAYGSRKYSEGICLQTHLLKNNVTEGIVEIILEIRKNFASTTDVLTNFDIMRLRHWSYSKKLIDACYFGNYDYADSVRGGLSGYRMILSAIPFSCTQILEHEIELYPGLALITFIPLLNIKNQTNAVSTLFEFNADGARFLWIAVNQRLHRYTLGDEENESYLLTENREMGASNYIFFCPTENPNQSILTLAQMFANKAGKKTPMAEETMRWFLSSPYSRLISDFEADNWESPLIGQPMCIVSHLKHGGVFFFQDDRVTERTFLLTQQLKHLFECAGGRVFSVHNKEMVNPETNPFLSISKVQIA